MAITAINERMVKKNFSLPKPSPKTMRRGEPMDLILMIELDMLKYLPLWFSGSCLQMSDM